MNKRIAIVLTVASVAFACLYTLTLPRTLEDEDSVNFAFGVEGYAIQRHRPHAPGYPVYIAAAKVSTSAVTALAPQWDRDRKAAVGLSVLSVAAGVAGVWVLWWFWVSLGVRPVSAAAAAILTLATPLYWLTAARPLSDMPGLIAAMLVQAGLLHGLSRSNEANPSVSAWPRLLLWAAAGAGLAIGVRSQTMWLTLPLVAWACVDLLRRGRARDAVGVMGAVTAGALAWALPLLWVVGGLERYLKALSSQATQDFSGVQMLAVVPSWATLKHGLWHTFVAPWPVAYLPWVVLALAAIGAVRVIRERPQSAWLAVLAFGPYLVFHLLFHEVETIRYALPFAVVVAGLAAMGIDYAGRRVGPAATMAVAIVGVVYLQPILHRYTEGAPVFRALQDIQREWTTTPQPPALWAHHDAWWATGRALDWYRSEWDVPAPPYPGNRETLGLVRRFLDAPTQPVWFLADPGRTDLARIDPRATRHRRTLELPPGVDELIGGLRPYNASWWSIAPPFWMLGPGWALTPDLLNETVADERTPDKRAANAWVRRGPGAARVVVGARESGGTPARLTLTIDGWPARTWGIGAGAAATEWIELPEGIPPGPGAYARFQVHVDGSSNVRLDQFDAAPVGVTMFALAGGWSPLESDAGSGLLWRRTERLSTIEVRSAQSPGRLVLEGDFSLSDFATPPRMMVWSGTTLLRQIVLDRTFSLALDLPKNMSAADNGNITVAVDLARTPDERAAGTPRREYGVRVTRIGVEQVPVPGGS